MNPTRSENLKVETLDGVLGSKVLKFTGPLTLQTLFDFQQATRKETLKPIVVDIGGVPYMDSAGLGSLISAYAHCQRTSRGFAITGVTERIRTLFEVTNVDGLLPCFNTVDLAEAAVVKSQGLS